MPAVSVLIPTHSHSELLGFAVESVLRQNFSDYELFIVGDGPDDKTRCAAQELSCKDDRIKYREFPKMGRTGEPHRHKIITEQASGKYIFYLSDDDIWKSTHLSSMISTFERGYNFCHSGFIRVSEKDKNGTCYLFNKNNQNLMTKNFIPLSCGAHTRESYMNLPEGWTETPLGEYTDHYMWKKLLQHHMLGSSCKATVVHFPSSKRTSMSIESRIKENSIWLRKI
jgi:glycosyltransferase involved in cell wall biosynthesis